MASLTVPATPIIAARISCILYVLLYLAAGLAVQTALHIKPTGANKPDGMYLMLLATKLALLKESSKDKVTNIKKIKALLPELHAKLPLRILHYKIL